VHGVMNTDNMSILGLTIDYGPYGWLDDFNPDWTPNTTDAQHGRYRYSQQANIALWNCYQLANALYPLTENTDPLEASLQKFQTSYQEQWLAMMAAKLGFKAYQKGDEDLFERLESLLARVETDMTIFYRCLANETPTLDSLKSAYYQTEHPVEFTLAMQDWLNDYNKRVSEDKRPATQRISAMNRVNPKYVFRNYQAQQAIDKADDGDYSMVNELLDLFRRPYDEQPEREHYSEKRPDWAKTKVGCSMLSCSS